jgi:hypothetical protein
MVVISINEKKKNKRGRQLKVGIRIRESPRRDERERERERELARIEKSTRRRVIETQTKNRPRRFELNIPSLSLHRRRRSFDDAHYVIIISLRVLLTVFLLFDFAHLEIRFEVIHRQRVTPDRRFEVLVLVGLHGIDDVRVRALENVHQDDRR